MKTLLVVLFLSTLAWGQGSGGKGGGGGSCSTCATAASTLTNTAIMTGGGGRATKTPSATSTLDSSGNASFAGSVTAAGSNGGITLTEGDGSGLTPSSGHDTVYGDSTAHTLKTTLNNGSAVTIMTTGTQYSKGSCTEVWGGSGTSFALTSGDDAISNNSCYNDSGVTRTITAVKCRNDNASNTTTVNPTFGAAGTGTTILSGALTCGNSYAYSATGTVSNASWTTGTGITPAMAGTLTGTSIAMIVEYTF